MSIRTRIVGCISRYHHHRRRRRRYRPDHHRHHRSSHNRMSDNHQQLKKLFKPNKQRFHQKSLHIRVLILSKLVYIMLTLYNVNII